jgi:hypothetical protein
MKRVVGLGFMNLRQGSIKLWMIKDMEIEDQSIESSDETPK